MQANFSHGTWKITGCQQIGDIIIVIHFFDSINIYRVFVCSEQALCLMPGIERNPRLMDLPVLWVRQTLINYRPDMLEAGKKAMMLYEGMSPVHAFSTITLFVYYLSLSLRTGTLSV